MDYKKKIEFAERVAVELEGEKNYRAIRDDLEKEGLYERDITNIMISARKVLGEKYKGKINEYLVANKDPFNAKEFRLVDRDVLETLVKQESEVIAIEEKKKITQGVKQGILPAIILNNVNTKFLPLEEASAYLESLQEIQTHNSGHGRFINLFGGIGLIVLTLVILSTSGRLFYVLPIIGAGMIIKSFFTKKMEYED